LIFYFFILDLDYMLTIEEGKHLVQFARRAVENKKIFPDNTLKEKRGVFVTIETFPEHELRGCIGFLDGVCSLSEAVQKAAISAAYEDDRFSPLTKSELEKVVFEVSVMAKPELISVKNHKEYFEKIKFGDGLIIECSSSRALFLPQVWQKIPDVKNFLSSLCLKCGLDEDSWKNTKDVKILKFKVQAFKENKPKGKIVEVRFFD